MQFLFEGEQSRSESKPCFGEGKVSDSLIDICIVKLCPKASSSITIVLLTLCGFSHLHKMGTKGLVFNMMKIKNKTVQRQLWTKAFKKISANSCALEPSLNQQL